MCMYFVQKETLMIKQMFWKIYFVILNLWKRITYVPSIQLIGVELLSNHHIMCGPTFRFVSVRCCNLFSYERWQVFNTRFSIGQKVHFSIPCGAFGNGMGGYLAKKMGVPIGTVQLSSRHESFSHLSTGKIMCATNSNDVVARTISSGDMRMMMNVKTLSPAMDIQYAYNLERLLYFVSGEDSNFIKNFLSFSVGILFMSLLETSFTLDEVGSKSLISLDSTDNFHLNKSNHFFIHPQPRFHH